MKLFNGHTYIILTVKQEEKTDFIRFAQKRRIKPYVGYSVLQEEGDVHYVYMNDKHFGVDINTVLYFYEIQCLHNKEYRIFQNMDELKRYVEVADRRKKRPFLTEKETKRYENYLNTLSTNELKEEWYLAKRYMKETSSYYQKIKESVEMTLVGSIKRSLAQKEVSLESVDQQLMEIVRLRDEIDDELNSNLFLLDPEPCLDLEEPEGQNDSVLRERIKLLLRGRHSYFHSDENSSYFLLNVIHQNLDIISLIFHFKLHAESYVSYESPTFDPVHDLGYVDEDGFPDYLVGKRKGKKWDYRSVLKRLLYTLRIYDCDPLLGNRCIPACIKAKGESYGPVPLKRWLDVETLANKLVSLKYEDKDDLAHLSKKLWRPLAVIVEPNEKSFYGCGSVTCMACMVSQMKRDTIYVSDLLQYFDELIVHYDFVFWNLLLLETSPWKKRPRLNQDLDGDGSLK